jgi:aspartate racemase
MTADLAESTAKRPLLGLLGGMGPQATADFYQKFIKLTPARVDQEHLPILIVSDPTIPDRRVHVPFFDIVQSSAAECRRRFPQGGRALVLATWGTQQVGLYDDPLARAGFTLTTQSAKADEMVQRIIAAVKIGRLAHAEADMAALLTSPSLVADVILLACTELPIAARPASCGYDCRASPQLARMGIGIISYRFRGPSPLTQEYRSALGAPDDETDAQGVVAAARVGSLAYVTLATRVGGGAVVGREAGLRT